VITDSFPSPAMKTLPFLTAVLLATTAIHAASITETYGPFTPGWNITDNSPVLQPFLQSVTTSSILSITEVTVSFELRGTAPNEGFASDLVATLLRSPILTTPTVSDPSTVLLNRVGLTSGDLVGFGYDGWDITLRDGATADIHGAYLMTGILSGAFQPDGRLAPNDTARPALLGVFNGLAGNGDWRLNVGDLAAGGTMQLVSWSLKLTGEDMASGVPEASSWAAIVVASLASLWQIRRSHGRSRNH